MTTDNLNIRLDEDIANQLTINKNLSQEIIVTNTDKVRIILNDHHKIIKRKIEWLSPLGIFITILATLLTAQFNKDVFGIEAILWKAIFIVAGLLTLSYSIYLIYYAIKYLHRGTIEEFIEKLKNQSKSFNLMASISTPDTRKIIIHSAYYGTDDQSKDITELVAALVSAGKLLIESKNSFWGDPVPGKRKKMTINCTINGIKKEIVVPEGKSTDLSSFLSGDNM